MFQWPLLPALVMRAGDLQFIDEMMTGKRDGVKPGTITPDELQAYKYTFQNYGTYTFFYDGILKIELTTVRKT